MRLAFVLIALLISTTVIVSLSLLNQSVTIYSHGLIRNVSNAYYVYKNESGYYQLIDLSDYSVVSQGTDFVTITNTGITYAYEKGGGTVYICPGEHVASQPIQLKTNVSLIGVLENPFYTTIKQGTSEIWYPGVIGIIDASNVEVAYLTIDMGLSPLVNGSSWPPKGNGITVRDDNYNDRNIYIHHVRVLNAACYGIKTHFASNIKITDVYVENAWWDCANIESTNVIIERFVGTDWGDVGIAIYATKKATVKDCLLYNGKQPPGGGSSGVLGFTIESPPAEDVVVSNMVVYNVSYLAAVYDGQNCIISNSIFRNGSRVVLGGRNNMIIGCQFIKVGAVQLRGTHNQIINSAFNRSTIQLQDSPDTFRIIGNSIINANPDGIRFLSNATNGMISGNHIYSDTTPSSTEYAINFGYHVYVKNITVTDNDFTYHGRPNFSHGVISYSPTYCDNIYVKNNLGYITENGGIATNLADGSQILHGLAGTPDQVILTCLNATYGNVPVLVYWDKQNTNSNYFTVRIYWVNGTAITNNVIAISWTAKYKLH